MSALVPGEELKSTVTSLSLTGLPMSRSSPVPFFRPPICGLPLYRWFAQNVLELPSIASGAFSPSSLLLGSYASYVAALTGLSTTEAAAGEVLAGPDAVLLPPAEEDALCEPLLSTQAVAPMATRTRTTTAPVRPRAPLLRPAAGCCWDGAGPP